MKSVAPFAGAWIEINYVTDNLDYVKVAPFAGAWIEIKVNYSQYSAMRIVAPFAGAWIEIVMRNVKDGQIRSHPSRVRGLKSCKQVTQAYLSCRTLRGCVD